MAIYLPGQARHFIRRLRLRAWISSVRCRTKHDCTYHWARDRRFGWNWHIQWCSHAINRGTYLNEIAAMNVDPSILCQMTTFAERAKYFGLLGVW